MIRSRAGRAAVEAPRTCHVRIRLRPGLALLLPLRGATHVVPADSFLVVGTRRVNLDRLPRGFARLVPPGYAHADAAAFEPLLRALGYACERCGVGDAHASEVVAGTVCTACERETLAAEMADDERARRAEGRGL